MRPAQAMQSIGRGPSVLEPQYEHVYRIASANPPKLAMEVLPRRFGIAVVVFFHVLFEFCLDDVSHAGSIKRLHNIERHCQRRRGAKPSRPSSLAQGALPPCASEMVVKQDDENCCEWRTHGQFTSSIEKSVHLRVPFRQGLNSDTNGSEAHRRQCCMFLERGHGIKRVWKAGDAGKKPEARVHRGCGQGR